jgi:glycosyltransferase involved in cell wall biosynthesis
MSAPLRILFLNPDSRRNAGCNLSLLSLIVGLDSRFQAMVATPADGDFAALLRAQGIEVLDYRMNNWWYPDVAHFFRSTAGLQSRVSQLATWIRERNLQLVHTNAEYAFEGALAAAMTGVPHVWNIRQIFGADLDILRFFPLSAQALGEIMATFSDFIVPNAKPLIGGFPDSIPVNKFRIIPSGIRICEPPDKIDARRRLRQRLAVPKETRVILTMGRISVEKDLPTFIETARILLRRQRAEYLHFVHFGSADSLDYLDQLKTSLGDISPCVTFAGSTDEPMDILRGADILLFTSLAFEGLARVCLEALMMELPIVSTRCLGPEEYLLHGETALLADPGDAASLASHVEKLLDDPAYGAVLAQAGHARVREHYSEHHVCALWMALYSEVIESRVRRSLPMAAEVAINLVSLCGQLGQQLNDQEKRLRKVESLTRPGLRAMAKRLIRKLEF